MEDFILNGNRGAGQARVDGGHVPGGGHPLMALGLGVPEQCRSLIQDQRGNACAGAAGISVMSPANWLSGSRLQFIRSLDLSSGAKAVRGLELCPVMARVVKPQHRAPGLRSSRQLTRGTL